MANDFGKRLAAAREHAGLTQQELATRVPMAQSTLAAAESVGEGSRMTAQIAHHCGVNAYWLATGEGDMLTGQQPCPATTHRDSSLADALPVVLSRLPGLAQYTADKVVAALQAATKPEAPLEAIERDLLQWLGDRSATTAAVAELGKRARSA